jgi:hypothetical protein
LNEFGNRIKFGLGQLWVDHFLFDLDFDRSVLNDFFLDLWNNFHWNNFLWNKFFQDLDVSPDFVAKPDSVAGLHSEERSVVTGFLRSGEANLPGIVCFWSYKLSKRNAVSAKIVAGSVYEIHIHGPRSLTAVSKDPLFCEFFAGLNLKFVAKTFLYKTTLVSSKLRLLFRSVNFFNHFLKQLAFNNLGLLLSLIGVCSDDLRSCGVLANKFVRRLGRFSNLEHGVLAVDTLGLTVLAEIVVVAN